jgi:hypothetical protein
MDVHSDFEAAFRPGGKFLDSDGNVLTIRIVAMGDLPLRSGKVALGDPFTGLAAMAGPAGALPSGSFPVELAVVDYPHHDSRVAVARVRFSNAKIDHWAQAEVGAGVDSGTAGFADGADVEAASDEKVAGALEKALTASYVDTFSTAQIEIGGGKVFAFSSGIGDGCYSAHWAIGSDGAPTSLCLDFDLLTESDTEDVEIGLPLPRGGLRHPLLEKHGMSAWVPWLGRRRLFVKYASPKFPYARWKLPDGTLTRVQTRSHNARSEFALTPAPPGARLLLRIAVGTRRMRIL